MDLRERGSQISYEVNQNNNPNCSLYCTMVTLQTPPTHPPTPDYYIRATRTKKKKITRYKKERHVSCLDIKKMD